MIELHPEVLKINGKSEFVILQEHLTDAEDLFDLCKAVQQEGDAPSVYLEELKMNLALD